jgi:hypothetical protein
MREYNIAIVIYLSAICYFTYQIAIFTYNNLTMASYLLTNLPMR